MIVVFGISTPRRQTCLRGAAQRNAPSTISLAHSQGKTDGSATSSDGLQGCGEKKTGRKSTNRGIGRWKIQDDTKPKMDPKGMLPTKAEEPDSVCWMTLFSSEEHDSDCRRRVYNVGGELVADGNRYTQPYDDEYHPKQVRFAAAWLRVHGDRRVGPFLSKRCCCSRVDCTDNSVKGGKYATSQNRCDAILRPSSRAYRNEGKPPAGGTHQGIARRPHGYVGGRSAAITVLVNLRVDSSRRNNAKGVDG